jgi:hypothetical protein
MKSQTPVAGVDTKGTSRPAAQGGFNVLLVGRGDNQNGSIAYYG